MKTKLTAFFLIGFSFFCLSWAQEERISNELNNLFKMYSPSFQSALKECQGEQFLIQAIQQKECDYSFENISINIDQPVQEVSKNLEEIKKIFFKDPEAKIILLKDFQNKIIQEIRRSYVKRYLEFTEKFIAPTENTNSSGLYKFIFKKEFAIKHSPLLPLPLEVEKAVKIKSKLESDAVLNNALTAFTKKLIEKGGKDEFYHYNSQKKRENNRKQLFEFTRNSLVKLRLLTEEKEEKKQQDLIQQILLKSPIAKDYLVERGYIFKEPPGTKEPLSDEELKQEMEKYRESLKNTLVDTLRLEENSPETAIQKAIRYYPEIIGQVLSQNGEFAFLFCEQYKKVR